MNVKIMVFIGIITLLGVDLMSTYLVSNGNLHGENELHFIVQVFGGGFSMLALIFALEAVVLCSIWYVYMRRKNKQDLKRDYKLLQRKVPQRMFNSSRFIAAIPLFIYIIGLGHVIAAINNLFILLYKNGDEGVLEGLVKGYIRYVHVENRVFLVYITIVIVSLFLTFLFAQRKKSVL